MNTFHDNIEQQTLDNTAFRRVIHTGKNSQLVLMCLKPGEEIGKEVHDHVDQFFRVEQGEAKIYANGEEFTVGDGDVIVIDAGTEHNVTNISPDTDLKLYTIYSPANHPDGTVHTTRAEAMAAEEHEHH